MKKDKNRKTRPRSILKRIKAMFSKTKPNKYNPNHSSYHPRHLARSVAKHNMAKAGMTRINSYFPYNWFEFVRVR